MWRYQPAKPQCSGAMNQKSSYVPGTLSAICWPLGEFPSVLKQTSFMSDEAYIIVTALWHLFLKIYDFVRSIADLLILG